MEYTLSSEERRVLEQVVLPQPELGLVDGRVVSEDAHEQLGEGEAAGQTQHQPHQQQGPLLHRRFRRSVARLPHGRRNAVKPGSVNTVPN